MKHIKTIKECFNCDLCITRTNIVNGNGNSKSKIIFIGEAPGYNEDKIGVPFAGKSGEKLEEYLELAGFNRSDIYITNIVKCRPPANTVPSIHQISKCMEYLVNEVKAIKPRIIVTLGNTALMAVTKGSITGVGRWHGHVVALSKALLIPTYHPSAILRNDELHEIVMNDFRRIVEVYREEVDEIHFSNI